MNKPGHAGWLGWPANISPAAQLYASVYKDAGSPAALRGLATNVANYNAWSIGTCPSYTQGNSVCDEKKFINAIAPLLQNAGFPAHFIIDTCAFFPFSLFHFSQTKYISPIPCNPSFPNQREWKEEETQTTDSFK